AGDGLAIHGDALAGQVGPGHVGDVVAAVAVLRPACVAGSDVLGARLGGEGEVGDLHAGVVVVELAPHRPAGGAQQARHAVAQRRVAAVAHVQRAGGVGRDVFHAHRAARAAGAV